MSDENELKNIANPIGVDTSAWSPAADVNPAVPAWLIPNKLYDILKWLAALVFPALALFMGTVGPAWGTAVRRCHRHHAQCARSTRRCRHRSQRTQSQVHSRGVSYIFGR